jgi:hypothetical protein
MDINSLMKTMLSSDTLSSLGKKTGTSQTDVMNVLSSALPSMLSGASMQANDAKTAESFVNALADHAKDSTADLNSFVSQVDLADGKKIVKHLLGTNAQQTAKAAAANAGVGVTKANNILAGAAPLLMSLLGQQASSGQDASSNNTSGISSLMSSLLSNVDVTSLLVGLLTSNASGNANASSANASSNANNNNNSGGILGSILGLFKG